MLQFTLTGRLAAEPEPTTYGPDNTPMARLRVASNQPGSERTDFFDVAVFGDKALEALASARKGDTVRLKGNGRRYIWITESGDRCEGVRLAARSVEHTPRQPSTADARALDTAHATAARWPK